MDGSQGGLAGGDRTGAAPKEAVPTARDSALLRRDRAVSQIEGEIVIQRPIGEVFDFVADERNEPRYNAKMTSVEQLSEGEIGLGTQFRAEVLSGGRPLAMVIEFTRFERPARLGSRTTMAVMVILGELTFEAIGESTRMRWSWELKPSGALRLLTPLIVFMGRRQEREIWTSLKRCLETRPRRAHLQQLRGNTFGTTRGGV